MKRLLHTVLFLLGASVLPMPTAASDSLRNLIGMDFIQLPAGDFTMGTVDIADALFEQPEGDTARISDETPAHCVTFERPFYLGRTEVTQLQWLTVMNMRHGPDDHWSRRNWRNLPVTGVTWHDTQAFIEKLNNMDPQFRYRLPTEAEWEYAARAGTTGLRPFPADALADHAWTIGNSGDEVQPVATRQASPDGLHDLFGNVWEWTADWYAPGYYASSPSSAPGGPASGTKKVRRGGSYHCQSHLVRSAYRAADTPDTRYSVIGFRLVAEPVTDQQTSPVEH